MTWMHLALSILVAANALWTWWIKTRTAHELEKLRQEHSHALEMLRAKHEHSLAKLALEHQIRFSTLHQRRFDVVADLYASLVRADRALLIPGSPMWLGPEQHETSLEAFQTAANAFRKKFTEHRIFLPPGVGAKFDAYWQSMMAAGGAVANRGVQDEREWWHRYAKASGEMKPLKDAIEQECRRLLGETEPVTASGLV